MSADQPQQSSWLKENVFMVAAIALPLVVAALFLGATALPKLFVEAPQFSLLVAIDERRVNQSNFDIEFEVVNGQLQARAVYSETPRFYEQSTLFRFTPGQSMLARIDLRIDDTLRAELESAAAEADKHETSAPLPLPADLADLILNPAITAPDGYRFRNDYRGGAGLFGELFGMRSRNRVVAIEKDGRVEELGAELEQMQRYSYYNVHFLGWIELD